jgi:Tol biopolymer transport system component
MALAGLGVLAAAILGLWVVSRDGSSPVRHNGPIPPTLAPLQPRANGPILFVGNRRGHFDAAAVHRIEPDGSGLGALTSEGDNPTPSADGTVVAYQLRGGEIRVIGVDGSGDRGLVAPSADPVGTTSATSINGWSANGSMLAFERSQDIWVVQADGTGLRNLTNSPTPLTIRFDDFGDLRERPQPNVEGKAAWSPTGASLAFVRGGDLYLMDADGADARRIFHGEDRIVTGGLSWSPDGESLAFSTGVLAQLAGACRVGVDDGGIHLVDADGTGLRQLTTGVCDGVAGWSPAADAIVFGGASGVEVIRLDGTGRRMLAADGIGMLSPDGKEAGFLNRHGRLFVLDVDGTARRSVTPRTFFVRGEISWAAAPEGAFP